MVKNGRMESWIRKACRRRAYSQLAVWILLTVGGIAAVVGTWQYWTNFFEGPYTINDVSLSKIHKPESDPHEFVRVTGAKIVDSGVQEITTETSNGVKEKSYASAGYYLMVVGDKFLIVKASTNPGLTAQGQLEPLYTDLTHTLLPDPADAVYISQLYPVVLNTTDDYRLPGYISMGAAVVLIFLLWRFALPAWKNIRDISRHPVVVRTEAWADPVGTAILAEREMSMARRFKANGVLITDNFIVQRGIFTFNILLMEDLLWAYLKSTLHLYNFIPTHKSHEGILICYGGSVNFKARKKIVGEMLQWAANRAPWAIAGYSDELKNIFKRDTQRFCAAVEQRRAEFLG
jgi:hypothetical protein